MRYPPSRWAMMILRLIVIVPFPLTAAHQSCVNRIRPMPQSPCKCASWSESGYVQIWDLSSHLPALAESETEGIQGASNVFNQARLVSFGRHKVEGYTVDWSPLAQGRLVTGDNKNSILLWEPTSNSKWNVDSTPFIGHSGSVEDLQSPTKPNVFAYCSADGNIEIWDTWSGKSPAISFKAHDADDRKLFVGFRK